MLYLFAGSFLVTLGLLGLTVWSGWQGRRRLHFVSAPATVLSLAVTILLTEFLVRAYEFPPAELRVHLVFAETAAAMIVPVVVTGLLTVKRRKWLRVHLVVVVLFLVTALVATGTGIWMFTLASRR